MPTYYTKSHSTFAHCSSCTRKLQDESCGAGLAPNKQESSQLSDAPSNTWLSARAKRSCSCRTHGAVLLLPACPPSACFLHTCCACDFAPMLLLLYGALASPRRYWLAHEDVSSTLQNCTRPALCELLDHRHPLNRLTFPTPFQPSLLPRGLGFRCHSVSQVMGICCCFQMVSEKTK